MNDKIPFIKLFRTLDNFYFFDVNSNSIVRINEAVSHKIEDLIAGNDILNQDMDIARLKKRGYLKANNENIIVEHSALNTVGEYMNGNLRQLILQVTQNCNLRCKYCVYSGSYVNRTHTKKRMSFEIAKQAVDFYFAHNTNKDAGVISFYGGEPLLEMELIKKIVVYSEKLYEGKELRFNMTSNATLLTDEIADFLYEHNFNLTISLDGPEEVHNQSLSLIHI